MHDPWHLRPSIESLIRGSRQSLAYFHYRDFSKANVFLFLLSGSVETCPVSDISRMGTQGFMFGMEIGVLNDPEKEMIIRFEPNRGSA
jgi:hypothetical protein